MKGAIFVVEGHTEQIFVCKFIQQMVTLKECHISWENLHNGVLATVRREGTPLEESTHHIRIINVENDEKVNSFVKENLANFKRKGFTCVYGLRDRYSGDGRKQSVDQNAIDNYFNPIALELNISLQIVVAIEEIEAWFLSVPDFFLRYDTSLGVERINEICGFSLSTVAMESIPHPAALIDKILQAVGQRYTKRQNDSHKIADTLNYSTLYLEKSTSIPALGRFVDSVEQALA